MDDSSGDLQRYVTYLRQYTHAAPTYDADNGRVEFDAAQASVVRVDGAPEGTELAILNAGSTPENPVLNVVQGVNPQPGLTLANPYGTAGPQMIEIVAGPYLQQLHFSLSESFQTVYMDAKARGSQPLTVQTGDGNTLRVADAIQCVNGAYRFAGVAPPSSLALGKATFVNEGNWKVLDLILEESATFQAPFQSHKTIIAGHELRLIGTKEEISLGTVIRTDRRSSVRLSVEDCTRVSLFDLPAGSTISLKDAQLAFEPYTGTERPPRLEQLFVEGWGTVELAGTLEASSFNPTKGALVVRLERGGRLLEATGSAVVEAGRGSLCTGSFADPLVLLEIISANEAEIERVNVFQLNVRDVVALREAEGFSPWIPHREQANKLQDQMKMDTTNEILRARRKAHFWTQLSEIVQMKNASGLVQSRVRYAAARARHQSAEGLEKSLLRLYSLCHYGEDIVRPLLLMVGVSLMGSFLIISVPGLVARDLCCEQAGNFVSTAVRLILAPLGLARFLTTKNGFSLWQEALGLVFAALNALLLFLSAAAVRRLTRAER